MLTSTYRQLAIDSDNN